MIRTNRTPLNRFSGAGLLPVLALTALSAWAGEARADELPAAGALRRAILDLAETFPDRYPRGREYLARLDDLERRAKQASPAEADAIRAELDRLRREALTANPLVAGQPILLLVRRQYRKDHHNTATMFQTGEINTASFQGGGAVKTVQFAQGGELATARQTPSAPTPPGRRDADAGQTPAPQSSAHRARMSPPVTLRTLLELPDGVARDPDVSFDGHRILFSMRRSRDDDYHLYQLNADGSGLVQLTFGSGISDVDPIYLPSGQILFTSTREPKYCMCNRHIMGNLFLMNGDGSNVQQIGHSTLHEGHAALMPDGRVLYDRWEYVDRNFGDAQGVWSVNPDGTNHAVYYGNNTNSPGAVLDTRILPGTERAICTFSSCHDRPWGAIAILDRRLGIDLGPPVVRTWPAGAVELIGKGNYDTYVKVNPKYEDPYPLSDKYFLCSRMTGQGEQMGIWLLDVFGNEVLLHAEGHGCFDPMPLGPRPKPPVIPPRIDLAEGEGYFYLSDVYAGSGMEKTEPGEVRRLRVVESPEKRYWTPPAWDGGTGQQAPGMAWDDFNNKRILGTVPVEPDGSAYFAVPADRFVYFQLLDASGRMIQSMRSGTIVRPGETTGCVGCHESRRATVPSTTRRMAALRSPNKLKPWYGPPRNFNYLAEVQPVFDKHCVECHDYGQPGGEKLNLAGDLGLAFNTSYVELRSKGYVKVPGAGPYQVMAPKSWGSHVSRLVEVLLKGHEDPEINQKIRIDPEGLDRIITWVDVNAPYYPEYASAYRDHLYGRSPLAPAELGRLSELVGANLNDRRFVGQVNFTRPEWSPCLQSLPGKDDPKYQEALALIRAGREMLARRPRVDMPRFRLASQVEIDQEAKYQARLQTEKAMRSAIAQGEKRYEKGAAGGAELPAETGSR